MSAHTPGPWEVLIWGQHLDGHPEDSGHEIQCGKHFATVARIPVACHATTSGEPGETVITAEQAIANAYLLGAAGELFDACIEARVKLLGLAGCERIVAVLDDAIAKAKGEAC